MSSDIFRSVDPQAWAKALYNVNELELDRCRSVIVVSCDLIEIRMLNPTTKKRLSFTFSDLAEISQRIVSEKKLSKQTVTQVRIGIGYSVQLFVKILVKMCMEGMRASNVPDSRCVYARNRLICSREESSSLTTHLSSGEGPRSHEIIPSPTRGLRESPDLQGVKEFVLKLISLKRDFNEDTALYLERVSIDSPDVLFNLSDDGQCIFDVVLIEDHPALKSLLFKKRHSKSIFKWLMMNPLGSNDRFNRLLGFVTPDDMNQNANIRDQMFAFAYSTHRYEGIFLNNFDIPVPLRKRLDDYVETSTLPTEYQSRSSKNYSEWLRARMYSSSTCASGDAGAIERWTLAENFRSNRVVADNAMIKQKSKTNLQLGFIQKMHMKLCREELGIDNPGNLRKGATRCGGSRTHLYCPPDLLESNLDAFLNWYNLGIKSCAEGKENPLILGAQAYQRLVSLHPFENGNGRVARMLMDYTLERFGLLPPILGDAITDALFPLDQPKPDKINFLVKIMKGVEVSRKMLL